MSLDLDLRPDYVATPPAKTSCFWKHIFYDRGKAYLIDSASTVSSDVPLTRSPEKRERARTLPRPSEIGNAIRLYRSRSFPALSLVPAR